MVNIFNISDFEFTCEDCPLGCSTCINGGDTSRSLIYQTDRDVKCTKCSHNYKLLNDRCIIKSIDLLECG
jgi:hypothetical protein